MNNKVMLFLVIILLCSSTLQTFVLITHQRITAMATYGRIDFCLESDPYIEPIPERTVACGSTIYYKVNVTSYCHNNTIFTDDSPLFEIGRYSGIINFSTNKSHIGYHSPNIHVFENGWHSSTPFRYNVTQHLEIAPIPNMEINASQPFSYHVRLEDDYCMKGFFSDNTNLFDINPISGWINFTPTLDQVGTHLIYIYAVYGPDFDDEPFYLTIKRAEINAPNITNVYLAGNDSSVIINWTRVEAAQYYVIYYSDNISSPKKYLTNTTNLSYIDSPKTNQRFYYVGAVYNNIINFSNTPGCYYSYNLTKGWNLIGTVCSPTNKNITSFLRPLSSNHQFGRYERSWSALCPENNKSYKGSFDIVWSYNTTEWLSFNPNVPCFALHVQSLQSIEDNYGYWIKMKSNDMLPTAGFVLPNQTIQLAKGWNLFSVIPRNNKSLKETLRPLTNNTDYGMLSPAWSPLCPTHNTSYMGSFSIVWDYNKGIWQSFNPNVPCFAIDSQNLKQLRAERGYWIKMNTKDRLYIERK